ncbi:MAG: hypothetical protein AAGN82_08360 [Myxococcota bacterium]
MLSRTKRRLSRPNFYHQLLALPLLVAATGCGDDDGSAAPTSGLSSVEVVSLEMQRGDGPAYLNERIPVTLTVQATSVDPANPVTEFVPVTVTFVDADNPESEAEGCSSASIVVEVVGNGEPQTVSAFVWPTSLCNPLVGGDAVLKAEVIETEEQPLATRRLFTQRVPLASSELVDIEYASLTSESSVAVFPAVDVEGEDLDGAANEDLAPTITVQSNLVLNGRDPYVAPVDPDLIPDEVKEGEPGLEEDLRFGRAPDAVGEINDLPGNLTLRYEITAERDGVNWAAMDIGSSDGPVPSVVLAQLRPGLPNVLSHELFLGEDARAAITDEDLWLGEENFLIRGCFVTDFEQIRGDGGPDGRCQVLPVVLIADDGEVESGLSSLSFDGGRNATFGNGRVGLEAALQTRNAMNSSGVFSDTEARLTLKGKIGRSYSFDLIRGFATLDAPLQGDKSVDAGLTLLGINVASFKEEVPDALTVEEDFSFSRDALIVKAVFGFGPVGVSFDLRGGGRAGVEINGQARLGFSEADCRPHLPAASAADLQARQEEAARIEARLADIEERVAQFPPVLQGLVRRILTRALLGRLRALGDLADATPLTGCVLLSAEAGPSANLTATAFGGISVGIAKAGVEADLDLARLALPASAELALGTDEDNRLLVFGRAGLDLDFTPVTGRLALVGRVKVGPFRRSKTVTIVRFSSPTIRTNLLERSMGSAEVIIP